MYFLLLQIREERGESGEKRRREERGEKEREGRGD
jgi:hypothetical protein